MFFSLASNTLGSLTCGPGFHQSFAGKVLVKLGLRVKAKPFNGDSFEEATSNSMPSPLRGRIGGGGLPNRLSWCEQNWRSLCEQNRNLRVSSDFCLSVRIGVNETHLASAEDRALRGRNLSTAWKPDRRQARRPRAAGPALLPASVPKRKIHLPAILRAMKNFNSLTALPHR